MKTPTLKYLFKKLFQDKLTAEERHQYFDLIANEETEAEVMKLMEQYWLSFKAPESGYAEENGDLMYEKVLKRIQPQAAQPKSKFKLLLYISTAAAIVLIGFLGIYLSKSQREEQLSINKQQEIVPGQAGATLTLGNGQKIRLSDAHTGHLAEEAGVRIHKRSNGTIMYEVKPSAANVQTALSYNTLHTERGETYQVSLPDGSRVWLNAASTLIYSPEQLSRKESTVRAIELIGEAYFEVAADENRPFMVKSRNQMVRVLGTTFNINCYPERADIKTTLVEGKLQVQSPRSELILSPGEQSLLSAEKLSAYPVETEFETAWKSGFFMFHNATLEEVMQTLSRWYKVEVHFEDAALKDHKIFGTISKYENIDTVLQMFKRTGMIDFEINKREIRVIKKSA